MKHSQSGGLNGQCVRDGIGIKFCNFAKRMMIFALKMMDFVLKVMNFGRLPRLSHCKFIIL